MRQVRKVERAHYDRITAAIVHLKDARDLLREAGCIKASAYVRRALKSAEGAERHAIRAYFAATGESV